MAYTKQTWADLPSKTTPINATRLGHIEDGIFNAAATADTAASTAGTAAANVGIVSGKVETLTERVNGLDTAVSNKVDKVAGKGLSTNDYDDTDKGKVDSLGTASTKNSTSVVTQSTDLVESGAVKDLVGWGNKNLSVPYKYNYSYNYPTGLYSIAYDDNKVVVNGTSGNSDYVFPISSVARDNSFIFTLPADTYTVSLTGDTANLTPQVVKSDGTNLTGTTFTLDTETVIFIRISALKNTTFNNQTCYIQLEKGSTATAYEPYHASVSDSLAEKCDNSTIAPTENGSTASQAYAVGSHAIRNGAFITWKNAKAQGETINDASDYTSGDVGDELRTATEVYNFEIDGASVPFTFYRFGKIVIASAAYYPSALTIPTTWTSVNVTVAEPFRRSNSNFIPVICPNGKIVYIRITFMGDVDIASADGSSIWLQGSGVTTL